MKNLHRAVSLGISLALALSAGRIYGNDRDLLYQKRAAPPNILILVANTESMAGCEPNDSALPNGQTCTGLTTGLGSNLAPFGIGDSSYSKMGKAKSAIEAIIQANPTSYYFGLTSESYTRQTVRTGTTKRYTFVAGQGAFCDGSTGGLYWACQPVGTAANFGPNLLSSGTVTTLSSGGVTYDVFPIGGVTTGGSTYNNPTSNSIASGTDLGNETWIQSYGGDANHQPYLVNSSSAGVILTNPTGNTTADKGNAQRQELVINYSSTTATSGDPYRIHQCSTNCTLGDSNFDGQKFKVTKKIIECPTSSTVLSSITVKTQGSGYTSVPTVSITGGGGSGATATASLGVVKLTLGASGNNYTTTPTCTISAPPAGGTQATCTVKLSGKKVGSIAIGVAGAGYTSTPTVSITGGGGSGATATASLGVVAVALGSPGSGYTSTPTVTITGGGGSGATAQAVMTSTSGSYPCAPSSGTQQGNTQTIDYVVPPLPGTNTSILNVITFCSEASSSCSYPMIYSANDSSTGAVSGEEMGWVYYADTDVSGNQSGWITNPASNPQPVVMIPHPYTPWKSYPGPLQYPSGSQYSGGASVSFQYTQSSVPCIQRSFRPLSSLVDNTSSHTQKDNYPIFAPTTSTVDGSGNLSSTECDSMIDGLWQTQFFKNNGGTATNEIAPVIFPAGHNGSGIDLVKMLTNTYQYFNGGNNGCSAAGSYVDGFCGGSRPDDPFKSCRLSAVILVTDSFTGSSPDFQFGKSSDPTSQLKAIGVPVFVIGYAMAPSSSGSCVTSLPDGTSTVNYGQCIAYYSGATTFGTDPRTGYYEVDSAASLGTALQAVLNSLDTRSRDFATATIPSVSATSAGIAYLSQFNPKNNRSIWEGHLRAYFLDPATGLVQSKSGLPDPTAFTFWTGSSAATGSLIWDAGSTLLTESPVTYGRLDGTRNVDPTILLTSQPGAGGAWSADNGTHTSGHDQMTTYPGTGIGRNVFFGLRPGDTGCSSSTYECLTQVPVGTGGTSPTPAIIGSNDYATVESSVSGAKWTVPSPPSSLPSWWTLVQGSNYVNIPSTPLEGSGQGSQALQNSFSFLRGNRDPVVEAFKLATDKFDDTHTTCGSLESTSDSPCYYGDVMGDLFHSNPAIASAPGNFRYFFAQDPSTATPGTYADRGRGYQTFYSDHAHRRKILYVGGDDGALHAFDVGVYNGDQSTYDPGSGPICPLCNKYDFGSGREIFAYAPRAGLNKIYNLAHTLTYNWTIDGPPSVDDAYIDVTRAGGTAEGVAPSGSTTDSDISGYTPSSTSHSWRTVLIGTEREGGLTADGSGITSGVSGYGGSVFALDVTDPDQTNHMKSSDSGGHTGVPECIISDFIPGTTSNPTNCTAPYTRILWELRDDQSTTTTAPYRTELSTAAAATTQDLVMTWSQPVIGRVKITVGSAKRDFFVAIFGGGYDHTGTTLAATNASGNTGNFLYMVDIETGKIIYKKNLGIWSSGASTRSTAGNLTAGVPGSAAVIDINNDGYLDTVYIGDTQGRLWKVDLTATATLDATTKRVTDGMWEPVMFFDEYLDTTAQGTNPRQPIFDRPAAFFIGNTSTGSPKIGISFGTGDRDNMPVSTDTNSNKFIIVVDPPGRAQAVDNDHPLTLADLTLASLSTNNCTSSTCLNANGYYLNLGVGASGAQIVNTDALVFNQQIFFNTFLHSTTPGNCLETGVPFIYAIDYATGVGTATQVASGSEVLSSDIIYSAGGGANATATNTTDTGAKVNVTASGDDTSQQSVKTGLSPTVKIKSWKEE